MSVCTRKIWKFQKHVDHAHGFDCYRVHDSNSSTTIKQKIIIINIWDLILKSRNIKVGNAILLHDNGREQTWTHVSKFLYTCFQACSLLLSPTHAYHPCTKIDLSILLGLYMDSFKSQIFFILIIILSLVSRKTWMSTCGSP
jgi:preprotein translocase subunit SecG